ncbi:ABC transporter ATP-binding protein [Alcaligenaceae bacterium]|nr:ABC transporter ATP-binding protein [Alcaligenaceae bacterium]
MSYALQTHNLVKKFGGLLVINNISLNIASGARHALIGPNGAGKTTLINLLTGVLAPTTGSVLLNGQDITAMAQYQRCKYGLARTFQINQLFPDLTILESVTLAVCERLGLGAKWWRPVGAYTAATDEAAQLLDSLKLLDVAYSKTHSLAYGRQRLVEIALALASQPKVLLLDEPTAGVPSNESRELFDTIARLPEDITILLIEHDMNLVFRFAQRISVLVNGALLVEDTPDAIANNQRVKDIYLGEATHD